MLRRDRSQNLLCCVFATGTRFYRLAIYDRIGVNVTERCNLVGCIAFTACTGVGGVTGCCAGRRCYNCFVVMNMIDLLDCFGLGFAADGVGL